MYCNFLAAFLFVCKIRSLELQFLGCCSSLCVQAAAQDMSKPGPDNEVVEAVWKKLLPGEWDGNCSKYPIAAAGDEQLAIDSAMVEAMWKGAEKCPDGEFHCMSALQTIATYGSAIQTHGLL